MVFLGGNEIGLSVGKIEFASFGGRAGVAKFFLKVFVIEANELLIFFDQAAVRGDFENGKCGPLLGIDLQWCDLNGKQSGGESRADRECLLRDFGGVREGGAEAEKQDGG